MQISFLGRRLQLEVFNVLVGALATHKAAQDLSIHIEEAKLSMFPFSGGKGETGLVDAANAQILQSSTQEMKDVMHCW